MRTLIYTIAQNGYDTAFLSCIASQRAYAKRLGAEYVSVNKPKRIEDTALSAWLKIPLMINALESGYDWVVYIDADCEVKSTAPDFRHELADLEDDVFMALGRSGRLNSGVMMARRSDRSVAFFRRVLDSMTESIPGEDRLTLKYENGNVIFVARTSGGVAVIPSVWNNTIDPELSDNVRHYTGNLRPLLKRSLFREVQYQVLKRVGARQLSKFQSQPESRDSDFAQALKRVENASVAAFPTLTARSRSEA
ncbi:putative nucleotide-diphospho-sugar transferase [Subtercola boreus]|uniref:Nucleotide-diphospho-sugar transferase domain-containing protein n=1 Tax=Subtercola boreus TaxID=120213 RepID=A0A3E0WFR3_9MICO|nr:putative nucleotide-diphospho-sugar transferase [Subtercola boreus]RFA22535.1 hypothetical protein B7R24_02610 [Subtercola boreus]RFA22891.1 hypothetical protein B7R23_02605 [Subtercola boreus]RFA28643.1 hypothetical protein B7R25_02620 [Subtercola boreus]